MSKPFKIIVLVFFYLSVLSCEKKVDPKKDVEDPTKVGANVSALLSVEQISNEIEFIARNVAIKSATYPNAGSFLGCASITRSNPSAEEELIEINFNAGTVCTDAKRRSGKVVILLKKSNADTFVSAENYKVNEVELNGQYVLSYLGNEVVKNRASFIIPTGRLKVGQTTIVFNLSKTSTMIAGGDTQDILDDVLEHKLSDYFLNISLADKTSTVKASSLNSSNLNFTCNDYTPHSGKLKVEYVNSGTNNDPNNPLAGTLYLTFAKSGCENRIVIDKTP